MSGNSEVCKHLFGSDTHVVIEPGLIKTLDTTPVRIAPINPDRISIVIACTDTTGVYIWPSKLEADGLGIPVNSYHVFECHAVESGALCEGEWWCYQASGGDLVVGVIEVETSQTAKHRDDNSHWIGA